MNKAIVLHSVEDAEHCVQNKLYKDSLLFSTHSSVDTYLKEYHAIDCQCLSKLFTNDEILIAKKTSSTAVDSLLQTLDEKISPLINRQFNINIRYFAALYSYLGKHHYSGYVLFAEAIRKIIKNYNLKTITFYNCNFCKFFDSDSGVEHITSLGFDNIKTILITSAGIRMTKSGRLRKLFNILARAGKNPFYAFKRVREMLLDEVRYRILSPKKKLFCYSSTFMSFST